MAKKVLLSGIQPSGDPHIGNYFGAMKQWVNLQNEYDSRICVVNLHALTTVTDKETLKKNTHNVVLDLLGVGIDPTKTTLFLQSDIPHVTELAWIFECLVSVPFLMQAHAYKDKVAKGIDANAGLFNYPMLMAADILVQDAEIVPVGQDQRQHVEYAREAAAKFNNAFGETFKEPKEMILDTVGVVPGTDGKKMSKSYNNTIPLFAMDEEIEKAVMSIVTDSGSDIPQNVYAIHALIRDKASLDALYEEKKGKYKELKEALIADLKAFIGPMRERRAEWESKPDEVEKIIAEAGMKMRKIVHEKMQEVREKVGLIHHE